MPDAATAKRILVVDDDLTQVKLLQGLLTQNNYTPIITTAAPDGLNIAMNEPVDLVILDVMMPIINGYNFCRLLKTQKKSIPIILVTSRDEADDLKIGQEMGADGYLTKPVNTAELLKEIKRLLGS